MIGRDLKIACFSLSVFTHRLGFFGVLLLIFVFVLGDNQGLSPSVAVGSYWVSFFVSTLMGTERIFAEEFREGILDQMVLKAYAPAFLVLGRSVSLLIIDGFFYGLFAPIFAYMAGVPPEKILFLLGGVLLSLPGFTLISTLMSVLTLGGSGSPLMMPVLILPLVVPVVIFSSLMSERWEAGESAGPFFYALIGYSFLLIGLTYGLGGAALKDALEDR